MASLLLRCGGVLRRFSKRFPPATSGLRQRTTQQQDHHSLVLSPCGSRSFSVSTSDASEADAGGCDDATRPYVIESNRLKWIRKPRSALIVKKIGSGLADDMVSVLHNCAAVRLRLFLCTSHRGGVFQRAWRFWFHSIQWRCTATADL